MADIQLQGGEHLRIKWHKNENFVDFRWLDTVLTTFIMQYDQKIKIGNKRNIEATDRTKQAIKAHLKQQQHLHSYDEANHCCIYCGLTLAEIAENTSHLAARRKEMETE